MLDGRSTRAELKQLIDKLSQNMSAADEVIACFIKNHEQLRDWIKTAAVGAALGIVVGIIIEDFATGGTAAVANWAQFNLAYRILRFAWAL